MRKILPFLVLGILILSGFGAVAIDNQNDELEFKKIDVGNQGRSYSHTILGEYGTATWCGYCKYAHGALKNIYAGGWHPFYYVSLVDDKNVHAEDRIDELTITGFPTVWFDNDYTKNIGAGSIPSAQAAYNSSIVSCGNRQVSDIDITLDVSWKGADNPNPENYATDEPVECNLTWTNSEMNIDITVDNNEGNTYNGHLHTYVTEVVSSMGWYDTGDFLYTFTFLDYAFNDDISISGGGSWQDEIDWDGKDYDNGYGDDFGGITQDNIMVIATVFDEDNNNYVDETAGFLAGTNSDPKTFDVYFGESNPPPLVSDGQSNLYYAPEENLDFETTYYWKIVVWDNQGGSQTGPIWSFTTRGNDAPNDPSNPDPYDGETDVFINTDVSWTCSDPDGDDVTYDVYFGTTSPPPKVVSNQTETSYNPPDVLDFDTKYYWKVVAWDVYEYSTVGSIWSFTTEENAAPNTPSEPDPYDGETDVYIGHLLFWTGGDPNPGDSVSYDLYFGTTNPPPLEAEDLLSTAYDPGIMELDTNYYWKIVSEDSQGLTTDGPIWHFTTESEPSNPPGAPDIDGPMSGDPGTSYDYKFNSMDPDGDTVKYYIDWGDGNTDETGFNPSGTDVTVSHSWSASGKYTITAYAEDSTGKTSSTSTFQITMPKEKTVFYLFQRSLERFPDTFLVLRQLLGL
jgi:hypothetical protein